MFYDMIWYVFDICTHLDGVISTFPYLSFIEVDCGSSAAVFVVGIISSFSVFNCFFWFLVELVLVLFLFFRFGDDELLLLLGLIFLLVPSTNVSLFNFRLDSLNNYEYLYYYINLFLFLNNNNNNNKNWTRLEIDMNLLVFKSILIWDVNFRE